MTRAIGSAVAFLSALLGIRSFVYWIRRPFDSDDLRDQALYAAFLTGRVGMWFALGGLFLLLSGDSGTRYGKSAGSFVDYAGRYQWFVMVFLVLAAIQLVAGYFLGRRSPRDAGPPDAEN